MSRGQKRVLARIIISAALLLAAILIPAEGAFSLALYLIPYLAVAYDVLYDAARGILNGQPFDENFLMAVATLGALALGEFSEAVAVMLFYQTGELFQSCAVDKSRRSISALMDIRPDYANITAEDGSLAKTDPENIPSGSIITILPGERIPLDGTVIEGESSLDTLALTGESRPRDIASGDNVISGCINISGLLKIRTSCEYHESTVSKILELVENAGTRKSRPEKFISKFARVYTPAVCAAALALALLPPLFSLLFGGTPQCGLWLYRALTFLVISCPCALVISIPLSFFAGIGGAGSAGILIKGSNYMESLSRIRHVVFDKTGTLTQGVFEVAEVSGPMDEERLLYLAAAAESYSRHPIALSLQKASPRSLELSSVSGLREFSGLGLSAEVDGCSIAVGNSRLMEKLEIPYVPCASPGTAVYVAADGEYAGCILIADRIKPQSNSALRALKALGIKRSVMLTGDSESIAAATAHELGIDHYRAELLPGDKLGIVEKLLSDCQWREKLAFVGDGINDAPVLSRADVGIAMGALGSDAAIEAADVVIMDDDPMKVAKAIKIASKCMAIVYQNIIFAIGIKLLCLALGAVGIANMWAAIFADVGVMMLAVFNAIRAMNVAKL